MKLLWLPGWYPVQTDPFNGDFIRRHAEAAAIYHDIQVIYVVRDEKGVVTRDVKMLETITGRLREKIIYYYSPHYRFTLANKIFSARIYWRLYRQAVKNYIEMQGKPDLVHVHIGLKTGIVARWIRKHWRIPYLISEQWTGYLQEAKEKMADLPLYFLYPWRKAMKEAAACSVVSDYLGQSIGRIIPDFKFSVIPNVVNTDIFKPVPALSHDSRRFIHISGLNYQKNPEDMIRAMALLKKEVIDIRLDIIGPLKPALIRLVKELELDSIVFFHPEMIQEKLAQYYQQALALILYSRYETFGCVIIEAQSCGLPVILSDLPVMHENAEAGFNAVFVKGSDPEALAGKLKWFLDNRDKFDSAAIALRASSNYNYARVGQVFSKWYESIMEKS